MRYAVTEGGGAVTAGGKTELLVGEIPISELEQDHAVLKDLWIPAYTTSSEDGRRLVAELHVVLQYFNQADVSSHSQHTTSRLEQTFRRKTFDVIQGKNALNTSRWEKSLQHCRRFSIATVKTQTTTTSLSQLFLSPVGGELSNCLNMVILSQTSTPENKLSSSRKSPQRFHLLLRPGYFRAQPLPLGSIWQQTAHDEPNPFLRRPLRRHG